MTNDRYYSEIGHELVHLAEGIYKQEQKPQSKSVMAPKPQDSVMSGIKNFSRLTKGEKGLLRAIGRAIREYKKKHKKK